MSLLGIVGHSQCTCESQRQALKPVNQVVEVETGVDVGYPLRSVVLVNKQPASPRYSAGRTTTRPQGLVESVPAEISSSIRAPSQTIELSNRIHKKPIHVLLDSGLTGNYISDHIAQDFYLIVNEEDGYE